LKSRFKGNAGFEVIGIGIGVKCKKCEKKILKKYIEVLG
jgi:hypothetical protein